MTSYTHEGVTLILGDCMDYLATLPDGAFDAVITDPPYGISGGSGNINKARGKGNYTASFCDTPEYVRDVVVPIIKRCIEICSCVIVTPGNKNFMYYPQPDSFGVFFQPAAVGLQTFGNLDAQPIFYYGKNASGKNMGIPCSYRMTEPPQKTNHPCSKPLKTWTLLVKNNTKPGQHVFDPFMGSGTTGIACIDTGRSFTGIEIDADYYAAAVERFKRRIAQPYLPGLVQPAKVEQAKLI